MPKMKTQQRMDFLLKMFDELTENQGDIIQLGESDITLIMEKCGFNSQDEIAFYINSLEDERLVNAPFRGSGIILAAQITIDGYRYLDEIR